MERKKREEEQALPMGKVCHAHAKRDHCLQSEFLYSASHCEEMDRKKDLIRQIRALEKVPVEKFKQLGDKVQARACHCSRMFRYISFETLEN